MNLPNAKRVYDFIVAYKTANDGNSPSVREILEHCHISSNSMVHYYLNRLNEMGKIRFMGGHISRGIIVEGGRWAIG